jgi:hypothetical protein
MAKMSAIDFISVLEFIVICMARAILFSFYVFEYIRPDDGYNTQSKHVAAVNLLQ